MKKSIFTLIMFAFMAIAGKVQAQCTVSDLAVGDVTFNSGNCTVSFSMSFTQEVNSGNKFAYIHMWTNSTYHTPASNWLNAGQNGRIYGNPSNAPMAADLVNTLFTVAIKFNGTLAPSIDNVYGPDGSVIPITAGLSISKVLLPGGAFERQTITGFNVQLPSPCAGVQSLKGDIWASQHATGQNVHCVVQGLTFNLNNPQITSAFKVCNAPSAPAGRRLNIAIKNNGLASQDVQFRVYKDNGDNIFSAVIDGPALYTSSVITLGAGVTTSGISLSSADIAVLGTPGESFNYWVEVKTVPAGGFSTIAYIKNTDAGCAPLPVNFSSFTANRANSSTVNLKWQTSMEANSAGFAVERNVNGTWLQVGYVNSQAVGGSSSAELTYTFVDMNSAKGISQYRIRQVDLDSKSKYSEIRSVRGDGQSIKTVVYPNPSSDGKVNIVFEATAGAGVSRDISVSDMSGRTIKTMKGVVNNNVTIDNLTPGIYSLRIFIPATGEQSVEKIVVNKR